MRKNSQTVSIVHYFPSITDVNSQIAYMVRMDDATVTLASLDDVYTLLSRVEQQYDTQKEYTVQLNATGSSGDYTVSFEKTQTDASKDIVSAVLSGQASTTQEDGTVVHDGITSIDFCAECNCQRSSSCKDRDCQCGHGLRSSYKIIRKPCVI